MAKEIIEHKGPSTYRIHGYIDVQSRLKQLEDWQKLWEEEDKSLESEALQLNMNRRIDVQKGSQIAIARRRNRAQLVEEPLELTPEAIHKIGFDVLRENIIKQFVQLSKTRKLLWMNNFLFIMTPAIRNLCNKLDNIRSYRSIGQQRNFLLGGDSGAGKTTFLDWYAFRNRAWVGHAINIVPIAKIDAPVSNNSPRAMLQRIILECGANYIRSDNEEDLLQKIAFYFQQCRVELLMIDEIEHVTKQILRRRILEISNMTRGIPIICASCNPLRFREGDSEVAGRWNDFYPLGNYMGAELSSLLTFIELMLPLPDPSYLPMREIVVKRKTLIGPAQFIEEKTQGVLRDIMLLLQESCKRAIHADLSHISVNLLEQTWNDVQNRQPTN
jgi:hypothetical protein